MFNRRDILNKAWAAYRLARPVFFAAGDTADKRMFLGHLFAKMLRRAWDDAKKAAASVLATAARFVEAQRKADLARVVALPADARSARMVAIRDELTILDYAPFGVRTLNKRAVLGAELDVLQQAEAIHA